MTLMNEQADTQITLRLFETFRRAGVTYAVVARKDATIKDVEAYLYGNTLAFPVYGDEHIFLLAIVNGSYAEYQEGRFASGLWSFTIAADLEAADQIAEEHVQRIVFR